MAKFKFLFLFLCLFGLESSFANEFSHWSGFAGSLASVKQRGNKLVLKVNGTVASCGPGPFFVRKRASVVSCEDSLLKLKLEYWRTQECDQAMQERLVFRVKVPKNCDFDLEWDQIGLTSDGYPAGDVYIIHNN